LLDAGIEIHEYHKSFLHAKVAVIDRTWVTIGSSNIDPLSLLLAREANVAVENASFACALHASLSAAMATGAREVEAEHWHRRPLPARVAHWACYGFARLLTGLSAYGQTQEFA
jgi:cardiolipin synthase